MIVWGGTTNPSLQFSASSLLNSGGRYDPDLNAWWSDVSLIEQGAEIGDICEPVGNGMGQFLDPVFPVNGKSYKIQLGVRQCQRLFRSMGFRRRKPRPLIAPADPEAQRAFKKTRSAGKKSQA